MRYILTIIIIAVSTLTAAAQRKGVAKNGHPKIKNTNVLIAPDQKPVIIERTEDLVIAEKKQNPAAHKKRVAKGHTKKLSGAKSAKAFAPGQRKKPVLNVRNKRL